MIMYPNFNVYQPNRTLIFTMCTTNMQISKCQTYGKQIMCPIYQMFQQLGIFEPRATK